MFSTWMPGFQVLKQLPVQLSAALWFDGLTHAGILSGSAARATVSSGLTALAEQSSHRRIASSGRAAMENSFANAQTQSVTARAADELTLDEVAAKLGLT